jgi:hypothetical protein
LVHCKFVSTIRSAICERPANRSCGPLPDWQVRLRDRRS